VGSQPESKHSKEIEMELSASELELIADGLCEMAIVRPEGEAAELLERVRAEIARRGAESPSS
jgi:hypothetical protein